MGGGGLGELAIEYGYQRFDWAVMLETVIILIILVQLVQLFGDYLAKVPVRKNKLNFYVHTDKKKLMNYLEEI